MKLILLKTFIFVNILNFVSAQKFRSQFKNVCGQRSTANGRIVGGTNAGIGEFPWYARIGLQEYKLRDYFCAGSLVTNRHVLTAEHCLYDVIKHRLRQRMIISLGSINSRGTKICTEKICSPTPVIYRVSKLITYLLNETTFKNDISIIELDTAVTFNRFITPICLPDNITPTKLVGEAVVAIGLGLIDSIKRRSAKILQKITITIKPLKDCEIFVEPPGAGQICAGSKDRDTCDGDSGGPLFKLITENKQTRYTQLGIVSFGAEICENDYPAVYTDVKYYLKWIDYNLDKSLNSDSSRRKTVAG